jgi:hypothetical protein
LIPNRFLCALIATLALASCANVSGDYKFDGTKQVGLAVGSITYETSIGEYNVSAIRASDTALQGRAPGWFFKVGGRTFASIPQMNDSELKARGGTFAVELPAGDYVLKRWFIRQGEWTYAAQRDIGIPFTVEAGKSIYLGNFHFDSNSEVTLRDEATRDLPVLRSRFSILSSAPLAIAVAPGTAIKKIGGDYATRLDLPTYIPIVVPIRK